MSAFLGPLLVVSGLVLEKLVVGARLVAVMGVKPPVVEVTLAVAPGLRLGGLVVVLVMESEEVEPMELQLVLI